MTIFSGTIMLILKNLKNTFKMSMGLFLCNNLYFNNLFNVLGLTEKFIMLYPLDTYVNFNYLPYSCQKK